LAQNFEIVRGGGGFFFILRTLLVNINNNVSLFYLNIKNHDKSTSVFITNTTQFTMLEYYACKFADYSLVKLLNQ
jgi:hypothetical protein